MKTKKQRPREVDKKVWSFFMIAFPTLLIIAMARIIPSSWWAQILLAFYQFLLLKQFLDNYYDAE